ncbi:Hypothetical protein SMAX5B_019330 [Scophthalmus maximus]|uniref:Uncharacterized protein n=1 Tax=Scophthalmus maximus TaxID=52904 RepID=A0A2U9BTX3_SCOMX|nr:Hypothetical protein SMAX5B_019330 [Scophthalmus maximus]
MRETRRVNGRPGDRKKSNLPVNHSQQISPTGSTHNSKQSVTLPYFPSPWLSWVGPGAKDLWTNPNILWGRREQSELALFCRPALDYGRRIQRGRCNSGFLMSAE